MRVISGKYKGRKLVGFDIDGTRPTMDRVKESLFGSIQNYVKDSYVLDLFAGSGALGIEALSNGASKCIFVDHNTNACKSLKQNLTGIDSSIVIFKDYKDALNIFVKDNIKFDLIFLDPPYKLNLINNCLDFIYTNNLINIGGIIVCEYETELVKCDYLELMKEKKFSTKCIRIYRRVK